MFGNRVPQRDRFSGTNDSVGALFGGGGGIEIEGNQRRTNSRGPIDGQVAQLNQMNSKIAANEAAIEKRRQELD